LTRPTTSTLFPYTTLFRSRNLGNKIYGGDTLMNLTDIRYLPRWVVLILDLCFVAAAIYFSCYVIEKLTYSVQSVFYGREYMYFLILGISIYFMFIFRTFTGIIRHSTFIDLFKLFMATFCTTLSVGAGSFIFHLVSGERLIYMSIPFSAIFFTTSFIFLFIFRLAVKEFFYYAREYRRSAQRTRIWVLGIDEQAVAVARAVLDNPNLPYHIAGFLTQRNDSARASLLGKPIYSKDKIENTSKDDLMLDGILVVKEMMSKEELNQWVAFFLEKDLQVYKAPTLQQLRNNDPDASIKSLQIEDLLNRKAIKIENDEIKSRHFGKIILV